MDRQYTTTTAFSTADLLQRTDAMQLDFGGQLRESFVSGALDSFGLGTVAREVAIPQGNMSFEAFARDNPLQAGIDAAKAVGGLFQPPKPPLSQEDYQSGPYFRKDIPWDPRMTEDRAAALAAWHDAAQVRDRRLGQTDGWAVKLLGNIAGQALDPINYIPFLGAAAKGAAVARLGVIGGHIATASADAAINTAIFGAATANERRSFGDDVSFQSLLLDTASAAAIGAVFGSLGGIGEARGIRQRGMALREITETHAALNDAVGSLLTEGEVRIRPETVDGLARIAERENSPLRRPDISPEDPAFRDWFGDSAVVDDQGAPQVLFHGTPQSFDQFDVQQTGGVGIHFTADREQAADFAGRDPNARVVPAYVKMEHPAGPDEWRAALDSARGGNPRAMAVEALKAKGYDGVRTAYETIAFDERQVLPLRDSRGQRMASTAGKEIVAKQDPARYSPKLDTRTPPPDAPAPELAAAQQAVGKPIKDAKALAEDFKVDYETGDFPEAEDFAQLEAQGRLSPEDKQAVDDATEIFQRSKVYADALEQAAICGMN